jgi:NADH-quinone oxidoreductase subunit G
MADRGALDFLVVQELFLTETAEAADVVLPAQSWAERDGTFTNGERRVQRFYSAIPVVGQSLPDWQIVARIGRRLGLGDPPFAAGLVFREITETVPQYGELSYRELAKSVEPWPRVGGEDLYYGGASYDNKSGGGRQWPAAAEAEEADLDAYELPAIEAAADGDALPLIATTALYRQGTLMARSEVLASRRVEPSLILHPNDAGGLDVVTGDEVTIQANGSERVLEADVDRQAGVEGLALAKGLALSPGTRTLNARNVQKKQERSKEEVL